jgi:hypothetical protein
MGGVTSIGSIRATDGFLVADAHGRPVGRVECSLYGTSPEEPDALAVRSGRLFRRHFIVPAVAIQAIDPSAEMIDLRLDRQQLQRFL